MSEPIVRRHRGDFLWDEVPVLHYKEADAAPFREVTRQVLFAGDEIPAQWRYFEVAPGGHTTLERHEHVHNVMVIRGRGECRVGERTWPLAPYDLIRVPPLTWHQFHAASDAPLGFLCLVPTQRDRPQLPSDEERRALVASTHPAGE